MIPTRTAYIVAVGWVFTGAGGVCGVHATARTLSSLPGRPPREWPARGRMGVA